MTLLNHLHEKQNLLGYQHGSHPNHQSSSAQAYQEGLARPRKESPTLEYWCSQQMPLRITAWSSPTYLLQLRNDGCLDKLGYNWPKYVLGGAAVLIRIESQLMKMCKTLAQRMIHSYTLRCTSLVALSDLSNSILNIFLATTFEGSRIFKFGVRTWLTEIGA